MSYLLKILSDMLQIPQPLSHCRRYALEAIINVIDYLPVHNYFYVPCYNCCGSRARISIKALGRTHMHVWNNKR